MTIHKLYKLSGELPVKSHRIHLAGHPEISCDFKNIDPHKGLKPLWDKVNHLLTKILKATTLQTSLQTTLTSITPLSPPTKTTRLPISDSQPLPNTPLLKNTNYSIFSTICILLPLDMTTYLLGFLD